jgi:hypothetical protein
VIGRATVEPAGIMEFALDPAAARSSASPTRTPRRPPAHPERICWGGDRHGPADDLACGEDKMRAQHPCEILGDDWDEEPSL